MARYAELQVTSNFSFLRGASHPAELFTTAAALGISALGIVDRSSFAGIVRAWEASKATGVRLVVGCRLDLTCGMSVLVYPTDRAGYGRLCQLLTRGKRRAGKGACRLSFSDLAAHSDGVIAILLIDPGDPLSRGRLEQISSCFGDRAYLAMTYRADGTQAVTLAHLAQLARDAGVATVATGDVLYHTPERRALQDVLSCIREKCTIDTAGGLLEPNADRHLVAPDEMARVLARYPDAVERSMEIIERCRFDLGELSYQYPNEVRDGGLTSQQTLEQLTWEGAAWRYDGAIPEDVSTQIRHELKLIAELEYAPYFLTVHSIVAYARSKDILCQGRGSAANSAVCFVLGITSIDPVRNSLLFERFISAERREPPDIDVDFEHERREEVIQWIYETYGRDRSALCATVTRYRTRGAIRDVGKAMGLSADVVEALAKQSRGWSEGISDDQVKEIGLNPRDRRLSWMLDLTQQIMGFPRHLGQHPGGFVLTQDRLDELVPVEPARMKDRQVIEWDKDDIDCLKFMKVDVLGLGMLGCMRRAFDLLAEHPGQQLNLATIPAEDPATYSMIQRADTIGTFQIESRAQMSMLPRLKPKTFYDLVIEVAIVRPGPIQGDMVHPYLRRRDGIEPVDFPTPELKGVLGKTLGVPLFQEQAMKVAIVCAGFTAGEADQLRRSMATFKFTGGVSHFKDKLIRGMVDRGYRREFAEKTFSQIEGFGSYGFPESHAASFALIAYASCWMKCHHPDVFCAALLNAQPMGFYAPAQIVRDAGNHGVEIRPISVNHSRWDCTLEPTNDRYLAVRLGFRMIKSLPNLHAATIIEFRADQPFVSLEELWRRTGVPASSLKLLADADAFRCLGIGRRQAGWTVRGFRDVQMPLFEAADREGGLAPEVIEPDVPLPVMTAGHNVVEDYRRVGLTLRQHPLTFLRGEFTKAKMITCADLLNTKDGRRVTVPGLVLVRQRPGTAKGVMFITIEDETGNANLIVWPSVLEKQRKVVLSAGMVACRGRVQREGIVIHVVAEELTDLTSMLSTLTRRGDPFPLKPGRADEVARGIGPDPRESLGREPRDIYVPDRDEKGAIRVKTRDFR